MTMILDGTNHAELSYPAPINGTQDFTYFCLIETSTPPNDTAGDQMLVGGNDLISSSRHIGIRLGDADKKFYSRQRLFSTAASEVSTAPTVAAASTVYRLALRYVYTTGNLTINVNDNPKVVFDGDNSPVLGNIEKFSVGCAFGNAGVPNALSKGRFQYATQWTGVALSDTELADIMDGTTKPKDSATTPDYSYPLISDGSSDIAGTALTLVNTPTFDGVDLWVVAGPTITGPDTTTEGAVTVQAGTLLDTVVTQSLISGSYSIEQTIDSATATTLNYVAESGVNQCTPSTPVSGVPLEPTITAAGITPYVVQQKADDGVNPPATRNITLNSEATHEVVQAMIAASNTTDGESVLASTIISVEDNMQYYAPKSANGMTITWAADGTFTTGTTDQTEVIDVAFFSPATGQWSCITLTIQNSTILAAAGTNNTAAINFFVANTGTASRQFNQAAIAYYKSVTSSNSNQFNVLLKAAQDAVGFVGYWPGDRGN